MILMHNTKRWAVSKNYYAIILLFFNLSWEDNWGYNMPDNLPIIHKKVNT